MDQKPLYTMLFISVDEVLNGLNVTVYCVIPIFISISLKCWMDQNPLHTVLSTCLFILVDEVSNGPIATVH